MNYQRDRQIVIKTQFNIHGSRGKDAGAFIANYVSRTAATDESMAYRRPVDRSLQIGDGVAFTLDELAIDRSDVLKVAKRVQAFHQTGHRAIQQMVISFDQPYLKAQHLVDDDLVVLHKNDYQGNYDDVRLREAVQGGLKAMIEHDGYRNADAIACIQRDTTHLHVHAVVYEQNAVLGRWHGNEEKGVIKQSSLDLLSHEIDHQLTLTRSNAMIPTRKKLFVDEQPPTPKPAKSSAPPLELPNRLAMFMQLYQQRLDQQALVDEEFTQASLADQRVQTADEQRSQTAHSIAESLAEQLPTSHDPQL